MIIWNIDIIYDGTPRTNSIEDYLSVQTKISPDFWRQTNPHKIIEPSNFSI